MPANDSDNSMDEAGQMKVVEIGGDQVTVQPDDTATSLMDRVTGPFGVDTVTCGFIREKDHDASYPSPADLVPHDLRTVQNGDELCIYRLKASHRPVYGHYVEKKTVNHER